jgi:serine/threonine protein phosphatase 1
LNIKDFLVKLGKSFLYFNKTMPQSKVYAIGDIHGCYKTFKNLLIKIELSKSDVLYLLGDYIDRGPRIKDTIDFILALIQDGYQILPIIGNHELMLLKAIENEMYLYQWLANSGVTTLNSFHVRLPNQIDKRYIDFFDSLKFFHIYNDLALVHGGLNFKQQDPFSDLESMVWMRNATVDKDKTGGRRIVCGHTPSLIDDIIHSLKTDRILLDGGCVYQKRNPLMGNLCALELNTFELFVQRNIEDF